MRWIVVAILCLGIARKSYADGELFLLRDAIIKMASTPEWKPKQFRGEVGKIRAQELARFFWDEAHDAGQDPFLVAAIAANESNFRMSVQGKHGEVGMMQILPKYSKFLRCESISKLETDTRANLRCALKEFQYWQVKCGLEVEKWLSAWNTGYCDSTKGKQYVKRVLGKLGKAE